MSTAAPSTGFDPGHHGKLSVYVDPGLFKMDLAWISSFDLCYSLHLVEKKKLPRSWIYTSVSHHYGAEIEKGAWAGLHCDSCATLLGSACKEFCKPHLCQPTRCSTKRSERDAWWRKRVRAQLVRVPYCAQRCQFHGQCQWHSIRNAEYVVSCLVPARYPGRQLATCYQVNYAGNFQTDARTICAQFFKRLTQFCDRNELWEAMHSRIQSLPR